MQEMVFNLKLQSKEMQRQANKAEKEQKKEKLKVKKVHVHIHLNEKSCGTCCAAFTLRWFFDICNPDFCNPLTGDGARYASDRHHHNP